MKHFIATVVYRVNIDDDAADKKLAEEVEAQRWQMFQKKFGIEPLELEIKELRC